MHTSIRLLFQIHYWIATLSLIRGRGIGGQLSRQRPLSFVTGVTLIQMTAALLR